MKLIKAILFSYVISSLVFSQPSAQGWRGIVPFHSTRAEVERVLGRPSGFCKCEYKTESERIRIDYSGERCGKGELGSSNVPPETVLGITVHSTRAPLICELNLDLSKLQKTEDPELRGYVSYRNNELGIDYNVTDDGSVYSIVYFGTVKDRTSLRCPK